MFSHSSGRSDRLIFYNWSSGLQEEFYVFYVSLSFVWAKAECDLCFQVSLAHGQSS